MMSVLFLQLTVVIVPFFHVLVVQLHERLFFHRLLRFDGFVFFYISNARDW